MLEDISEQQKKKSGGVNSYMIALVVNREDVQGWFDDKLKDTIVSAIDFTWKVFFCARQVINWAYIQPAIKILTVIKKFVLFLGKARSGN